MAQVSLQINGYGYFLACGDGEEDHLLALAADLDRRIDDIKAATGPSGEARLLLMAALMLSDELHDVRQQTGATAPSSKSGAKLGKRLRGITRKAEAIADSTTTQPRDMTAGGTTNGDATRSGAGQTDATQEDFGYKGVGHKGIGHGDIGRGDAGHVDLGHDDSGHDDSGHGDVGRDDAGHDNAGHDDVGHGGHESKAPEQVVEPSEHT